MWLGKTLEFCDYWIEPGILHHQQYFWIDRWFGGGDVISLLGWVDFCQSNLFLIESIWVQRWSMNTQTLSEMWIIRDQCSIHIHTYIYGYLQIIQIIYVYLIYLSFHSSHFRFNCIYGTIRVIYNMYIHKYEYQFTSFLFFLFNLHFLYRWHLSWTNWEFELGAKWLDRWKSIWSPMELVKMRW